MSSTTQPQPDGRPGLSTVEMRYQTLRTSSMTFEAEKARVWMKNNLPVSDGEAVVLNACAGETRIGDELSAYVIRNDINPQRNAMMQVDVAEIGEYLGENSVDVVIHDPPFSAKQSRDTYKTGEQTRFGEETMSQFRRVLKPGGKLIQWAYSPQLHKQFQMEKCTLWNRIGRGYDYVSTVQTYRPERKGIQPVEATQTVPFNPFMPAVTGNSTFGGNRDQDIEMSLIGSPTASLTTQLFDQIDRIKDGLTLIITDQKRDYGRVKDRNTAIISLSEGVTADNYLGIHTLSDAIPTGVLDTVVIDVDMSAFCWNTYYEKDKEWAETTERSGYAKALKIEASKLLSEDGQLIQVGQTATNTPKGLGFIRTHVALTTSTDRIVSPFVTVDRRVEPGTLGESSTEDDDTDLLWPMGRLLNERTPPSTFRYTTEKEGIDRHPAYAVDCPECGSVSGNLCLSDEGEPVPHGYFHTERGELGEHRFYSAGLMLPLREYLRGWIESTDPARPKTAGGVNETPPAAQEATEPEDEPDDDTDTDSDDTDDTGDESELITLTLSDF